jgi:hypothetical protein
MGNQTISGVLPWETQMQYDQMIQQKKDQFQNENEQKMARIVDMEKEQQTGMGVYDKALEDHYEKLHLEMGKVITKYRDPFTSIEGMREIKGVSSKYVNNQYLVNAAKTKEAYDNLKKDYAANRITNDDFQAKEAEYNEFITNGGADKVFEYARPDYTPIEKILATTAQLFDKTNLKDTRNQTVSGYKDEQFDHMADMAYVGPENKEAILKVQGNLKALGADVTPESTKAELVRLLKLQFPLKTDNRYYESSGSGSGSGSVPSIAPDYFDSAEGVIPVAVADSYVNKGKDGSVADLKQLTFGQGQEKYSMPMLGSAKFINANRFDRTTNSFNSRIATTKQNLANGAYQKISGAINELGLPANSFASSMNKAGVMDQSQFDALGIKLGFTNPTERSEIYNEYASGKYSKDKAITVGKLGTIFGGEDVLSNPNAKSKPIYSANAYLYHIINKNATPISDTGNEDAATKAMLAQFMGNNPGSEPVYVDGVNVSANINPTTIANRNQLGDYEASKRNERSTEFDIESVKRIEYLGGTKMASFNADDVFNGIALQPGGRVQRVGKYGFDEILSNKEALPAFAEYLENVSKRPKEEGKTLIEQAFRNWPTENIKAYMNSGGEKSLVARFGAVKAKITNGEDVTPEEKYIYQIGQEYAKLPK